MNRLLPFGAVLLSPVLPLAAQAQGYSTDIELVRPTFSPRSTLGVDSPFIGLDGTFDVGLQTQYVRDPLRLIEFGEVQGAVVRNRFNSQLGAAWAPSDRVSFRGSIPVNLQWGSDEEDYAADGLGMGDISAGLRYQFWEGQGVTLGAHGDLVLNVGTRSAYMGETQPRTAFGLLTAYEHGPLLLLSTASVQTRSAVETNRDFYLGNELIWNSAAVLGLPDQRTSLTGEVLTRFGMSKLFQGGAESSMEWMAGAQYRINDNFRLDLGLGRGITAGYGTSSFRGLVGLRFEKAPQPVVEEPDFIVEVIDLPDDEPDLEPPVELPPPTGEWREGELARVTEDRIVIRDPIQFEFNTARILPASLPTLKQMAALLNRDARIGHLLIEGHASEEGSYAYNYDLSIRRAKAVFEQLIVVGVHAERMSYRGLGEVVPVKFGEDEQSLAENRRVEFEIIRQYVPGDDIPPLDPFLRLPWSGEPATVVVPPPLPKPRRDLLQDGDTEPDDVAPSNDTDPTDAPALEDQP